MLLCLLGLPLGVQAATFIAGEERSVLDTASEDDVYIVGQQVEVSAEVRQDVYAAGETVSISGAVGDDAHAAGQMVEISGDVAGDVFAAGQNVTIADGVRIGGDVYGAAGRFEIGSGVVIAGDVVTFGQARPFIDETARVEGELRHTAPPEREFSQRDYVMSWVRSVLMLFVVSIVVMYLFGGLAQRTLTQLKTRAGASLLTGIIWLVLFLPIAILLMVTIIGLPLGLLALGLTAAAFVVAAGVAALTIGQWIMSRLARDTGEGKLTWAHALLGAVVYESVQLLPIVGGLATLVLILFVFGALVQAVWGMVRYHEQG